VHCDGHLVFANPAAADLVGADSPNALLGLPALDLVHPDDREFVKQRIRRNQDERLSTTTAELRLVRLDGKAVNVESLGMPFTINGRAAALSIVRDVSERKHLEQQLAQSQKMDAVGQLAGGVAHDFNNLLTVITSYSALAIGALDPSSPVREDVEEISKAASRAADLTRQLLAFSRKQMLQPVPLDLNQIVTDIDKMLRRLIGEDIELVTACSRSIDLVNADPGQVEQVIVNLAVNARDAMPHGGSLTIETANVALAEAYMAAHSVVEPGSYVLLAVSDTGSGMDAAVQARVFEPFFTTKPKGQGTGLGLATVYGIVKQSGGYIWLYSELGRGTTFKVYLPRIDAPVESTRPAPVIPASLRGSEAILLVEDQEEVRKLVRRMLEGRGYRVLVAASGHEALRLAEQQAGAIHLLVTDVVMPGMSGREVALLLAPTHPTMKVLYLSGYTDESVVRHGILEPGVAFLQKPFTAETLARKVREVLDSDHPRS